MGVPMGETQSRLARIVLIRHGDTVGESRIRFHGATDVALSDEGRAQAEAARLRIPGDRFDRIVSSTMTRAFQTALIVARGRPILLEHDFREIDFGRWEGLTKEEIEARDPILYEDWQADPQNFDFPEGERRSDFRRRVREAFVRFLSANDPESAILVAHKGVVRTVAEMLTEAALPPDTPALGGVLQVTRTTSGQFSVATPAAPLYSSPSRSEASTL